MFTEGSINQPVDATAFEPPRIITLLARTDEQKQRDNERLRREYGHMLGTWVMPARNGQPESTLPIRVDDGFLTMQFPGRDVDMVHEPDEDGRMVLVGLGFVWLEEMKDESGAFTGVKIMVRGNAIAELTERRDDADTATSENEDGGDDGDA